MHLSHSKPPSVRGSLSLLCVASALWLCACGGGQAPVPSSAAASPTPTPSVGSSATTKGWARNVARGRALAFDAAGNLIAAGGTEARTGSVSKYSPTGDEQWTTALRSERSLQLSAVAVDPSGSLYIAGGFVAKLEIAGTSLTGGSPDRASVFVAKLDGQGAVVWAKAFGGSGYSATRALALDSAGNLYMTGTYQREISFGGERFQSHVFRDIFAVSLDPNGNHRWSLPFGAQGPIAASGTAIVVDDHHVYVAGVVDSDFRFGADSAQGQLRESMFVVGLSMKGRPFFRRLYTGTHTARATALVSNGTSGVTLAGTFSGSIELGRAKLTSLGETDALVTRLDASGLPIWAKRFGGESYDRAAGVAGDDQGNTFVLADVTNRIDLDQSDVGRGKNDVVLASFDSKGQFRWLRRYGNTGPDKANAITRATSGALAMSGTFDKTIDPGDPFMGVVQGAGPENEFVFRFATSVPPATHAPAIILAADPEQATEQAFLAAEQGDIDTLKKLVPARVDVQQKRRDWSLVMQAAFHGKAECVRYLIAQGADPNAALQSGYTSLMQAVRWGHLEAAKTLLAYGAKVETVTDKNGSALHVAVDQREPYVDVVRLLLAEKAPLETRDGRGRTPLLVAIERRNDADVQLLLESGADVNASDEHQYSALGRAATAGNEALVDELSRRGAKPDAPNTNGWTPLTNAAHGGHLTIVQKLLERGAKVNGPVSTKPISRPLYLAAMHGHTSVVELLLTKGALPNEKADHDRTPAHAAAVNGHLQVLRLLRKAHANFALKDDQGSSVLDVARKGPTADFVRGNMK